MRELKDTVELMLSDNYKDRLKAETMQTAIRTYKLADMLSKWDALPFKPTCPKELLEGQITGMLIYLAKLTKRCEMEGIEFDSAMQILI